MRGLSIPALLRVYPRAWRERYGDELAALIMRASGGSRPSWRVSANVALAGGRERLRSWGLIGDGLTPEDRARSACLLVLWAWMLFVVGGAIVQKTAEHWQTATPRSRQALPTAAFQALVVTAAIGSVLVLVGAVLALPRLRRFLQTGGWLTIRRPVIGAASLTGLTAVGTVGIVVWAHRLSSTQRNGLDHPYLGAGVVWALVVVVCLVAWTAATVATARRMGLTRDLVKVEASLAAAVSVAMAVMTIATGTWWAAMARAAPWFLAGAPSGAGASGFSPHLAAATVLMALATALGAVGSTRAFRSLRVDHETA